MFKFLTSTLLATMAITFSQFAVAQQFIDISKGGGQICGVTSANTLICSTADARLEPPASVGELLQVEVGANHACGLQLDGSIVCWGDNDFGQLNAPTSMDFESIDVGRNHTCAITTDLETVCWGLADNGRLQVPNDGLPFIEVDAGIVNTCALEVAGRVRCWGVENFSYDPPSADAQIQTFAALSSRARAQVCVLLSDGSVECDTNAFSFTGAYTDLAAAGQAMCALSVSGEIECQPFGTVPTLPSLNALNDGSEYVELFSGQGLCAIDVNGDVACADAERAPGSNANPSSNSIPLPSVALNTPSAVDDLTASIYSVSTIELFWTSFQRSGDGQVAGAEIYRDGILLAETTQGRSYIDNTLEPGIEYSYEVRIINTLGDVGPAGNLIMVNTTDRTTNVNYTRPARTATPDDLRALIYSDTSAELFWNHVGRSASVYEIYRDHEYLGFVSGNSYLDNSLLPGNTYHYDVLAVDQNGVILGFDGLELEARGE